MSENNIYDLAAAHYELVRSTSLMGDDHPGREAANQALVDLSRAISERVKMGIPRNIFLDTSVVQKEWDWEGLSEDVTDHAMSGPHIHEDGRQCFYHNRLDAWVFKGRRGRITLKCGRLNHVLKDRDTQEEAKQDWEELQFGVETRKPSQSAPYGHQDGRMCVLDSRLGMWLFEANGHWYTKRCLRMHDGE